MPIGYQRLGAERKLALPMIALLLFVCFARVAAAQKTDASIVGEIKDASGLPLPGVTVTATSPAMQLSRVTAMSDAQGEYSLTPLPIGDYTVEYSLQGFQTIRQENIPLTAGFVARLNQVMQVSSVTQTVTVSGAAPVIDTTSSTSSDILTENRLETAPNSNFGYVALVNQAPGVRGNLDIGGTALEAGGGGFLSATVFGQLSETWQLLEGVSTNSAKEYSQSGSFLDYYSVQEAKIETAGANAETRTPGVTIQTIVKSGGNAFHGSGLYSIAGKDIESSNLTPTLIADGVTSANTVVSRSNWAADIGGPIKKDKLWFYQDVSFRSDVFQFLSVALPSGAPATNDKRELFFTSKLTYQLTPKNQLIFFNELGRSTGLVTFLNKFNPWSTRVNQTFYDNFAKLEWQYIPRNDLVTSLQVGFADWNSFKECPTTQPSTTDLTTQLNSGCDFSRDGNTAYEPTWHARGVLTWSLPHSLWGDHSLDFGFDYLAMKVEGKYVSRGAALDYQLVFKSGVPFELNTDNFPVTSSNITDYTGIYGQDRWTLNHHVTINWGLRYSHDDGFVPRQCAQNGVFTTAQCYSRIQFPIWNTVAPRLAVTWDLTGSGKTVLTLGWGRFDHPRAEDPEVDAANVNTATSTTWHWHDLNGDNLYEPGEVNLNPNGPDFVTTSPLGTAGGTAYLLQNPKEKEPKQNQITASVQREVMANTSVRVLYVYAYLYNNYLLQGVQRPYSAYNIPITLTVPLANGSPGTSTITYYEYASALSGLANSNTELVNDPRLNKWYHSIEVEMTRRLSRKLQFQASYATTRYHEPIQETGAIPADTPNAFIGTGNFTWDWLGRIEGSYVFPHGINFSANFENRSGAVFARQALFTTPTTGGLPNPAPIPTIVLNVEPLGRERDPSTNLLDMRVEKTFPLGEHRTISVRMNVYNALNINTVLTANARSGSTYLEPTTIAPPRIFEFGTQFKF